MSMGSLKFLKNVRMQCNGDPVLVFTNEFRVGELRSDSSFMTVTDTITSILAFLFLGCFVNTVPAPAGKSDFFFF